MIRPWPSVGHVYAEAAAGHGRVSPDALNRQFREVWRGLKDFNHGREDWAKVVDRTFAGLIEPRPSETFFPELYDRFGGPGAWRVFDDVIPTLNALAARGLNLAVISNWDERLNPLLEKLGLRKYFDPVVISWEVGFTKPSPVIFEHAAKKLGEAPEAILHVGDDWGDDVEGAKSAGFQAVLIDRDGKGAKERRIGSLMELEEILN